MQRHILLPHGAEIVENFGNAAIAKKIVTVEEYDDIIGTKMSDMKKLSGWTVTNEESFVSLLVLNGSGVVTAGGTSLDVKAGDSIFIPADCGETVLNGEFKVLVSTL